MTIQRTVASAPLRAPAVLAASALLATAGMLVGCSSTPTASSQRADFRPTARDAATDRSAQRQAETEQAARSNRFGDRVRNANARPAGSADAGVSADSANGGAATAAGLTLPAPDGRPLPVQRRFVHSSGIPVTILATGTGPQATAGGSVTVHTTGTFTADGSDFYTTVGPDNGNGGEPMVWDLDQLINGWKLVVPDMRVGDVWVIEVPWNLAYGEAGREDDTTGEEVIPPRADLTFAIELFDVGPSLD